ncbi:ABC transporter ATP-binding protein [Methanoplanus sp. FWC-SCC4]|uniref:ABC transporter ATP-binding protein n=1 Tax=Methanochimaera problematica TaxID=2609417 RepID=A0AA97FD64_9EURY|nr:ABC transporter ATP-binding protein [Methanoplanus sp. FWC-SCC4]WOF16054.1 ABC transporter ATP-binding protein [Methanoplanus sp. FWC-SCC4]
MIEITGLKHKILSVNSLLIPEGYCCVTGENGSGKSTLLKLCSGIERPDAGKITIDNKNIRSINVGYVSEFPDRNIIFENVFNEIASPLRFSHYPSKEIETIVQNTSKTLGIANILNRRTTDLSGGEKTFVSLATALVMKPEILVLDETDSHLDFETNNELKNILCGISEISHIIHCTQDMNTAYESDYVLFLQKGNIEIYGKPDFVFEKLKNTCFYPHKRRLEEFA